MSEELYKVNKLNQSDLGQINTPDSINVIDLIKCKHHILLLVEEGDFNNYNSKYFIIPASPAKGILFVTNDNPEFISGHVRLRGKDQGRYPYNYLEMIDNIFGKEENTIEVCSRSVKGSKESPSSCFTVDINPNTQPDLVDDGQTLDGITNNRFNRWRCDPPYNLKTAQKMYGTKLPITGEILKAGARGCKVGSLLFLLLGPQNYQWCPPGVKRIGWVAITIIPNNELRALHIFYKYADR
ncbi:MAG TPA: hypothetical protein VIP70_10895 [Nitrososphaeraceae archaeon]